MKKLLVLFSLGALAIFLCTGTSIYQYVYSEDTDDCIWTITWFDGTNGLPYKPYCDYIGVQSYTYGMKTEAWGIAGPCSVFVKDGDTDIDEGSGRVTFLEVGADSDQTGSYAWTEALLTW